MKRKKAAKKAVRRKSTPTRSSNNSSFMNNWMDKKHRPWHGLALGGLMFLFQSVWGLLALLGGGLMIISALALVLRRKK